MDFNQEDLSINCPVIYGEHGFPLIILVVCYLGCLLVSVQETLQVIKKSKWGKSRIKKSFLGLISIFLLIRTLCLLVPFPFERFSYLLVCDQVPRYFIFLSWQFLAIWLGSAVLSTFTKNRSSRTWIAILFIVIFVLLIGGSIATSILTALNVFNSNTSSYTKDKIMAYVDIVNYITIVISILIYWVRLLQIYIRLRQLMPFQSRIKALMILIFIMCSIFFARLVYVLCYVLDVNIIQTKMGDLSEAVIAGRKPVWEFNSFYLVFYVIFEIVPSVLLLMIYFMLSVHTTSAKKEKKQMSGQTHPIEKGKGNVSYAERDRTGREKNGSRAKSKDKKRSAGKKKTAYLKDDDEGFYSEPWRMSGGGKGKAREEGMFGAVHNVGGERGSEGEPEMSKPLLYERAVNQTGGGGMGWSEGGRESGVAVRPDTSKASGTIKRIPSVNLGTQPELFDGEPSYYYTPKSSKPTSYIISL